MATPPKKDARDKRMEERRRTGYTQSPAKGARLREHCMLFDLTKFCKQLETESTKMERGRGNWRCKARTEYTNTELI